MAVHPFTPSSARKNDTVLPYTQKQNVQNSIGYRHASNTGFYVVLAWIVVCAIVIIAVCLYICYRRKKKRALARGDVERGPTEVVESFKRQISQRSHERLMDQGVGIGAYADALATIAVIDDLDPKQVLELFLDSRNSWISQKLSTCQSVDCDSDYLISVFCNVVKIIQVSLGQVGELFLQVLNDTPLFYNTILGSSRGSQLFGGLPNPEEEVTLRKMHQEKLESVMVTLERDYIADVCSQWLRKCGKQIGSKINGRYLVDIIKGGKELALAERLIRESLDNREVLEGSSLELVLKDNEDLWDGMFEDAFVRRMKEIVNLGFKELRSVVNVRESIEAIMVSNAETSGQQAYLNRPSTGGGVWFLGSKATTDENDTLICLNAYLGPEVGRIRDEVDSRCKYILDDLLCFLESPKASSRLNELASDLQEKCYGSVSAILGELENDLENLSTSLGNHKEEANSAVTIVERSLFIGRLLFALGNHSSHIPLILGSPRQWVNEMPNSVFEKLPFMSEISRVGLDSPVRDSFRRKSFGSPRSFDSPRTQTLINSRRQMSSATAAFFGLNNSASPNLEVHHKVSRDLYIKAHTLWISWVSDELSTILSKNLKTDEALSATNTNPMEGWEETVIKQKKSDGGSSDMKISLPSMPSLYVTSFLFQACGEIQRVGGHIIDKSILQKFAARLSKTVIKIYGDFVSTLEVHKPSVTERGVLQIILDLRFTLDVLSGGDLNMKEESPKISNSKLGFKQYQGQSNLGAGNREVVMGLINSLKQRLDQIDWATYEPFLWENGKQAYLRHSVLFGFFVQLNRMHINTAQQLPSNAEINSMRCSTVPHFKYLPVSAPVLLSKGTTKSPLSTSTNESDGGSKITEAKICDICGDAGQEDLLAICSRCSDGAEHTYCMRIMLDNVPEGDWICEGCQLKEEDTSQKKNNAETVSETLQPSSSNERIKKSKAVRTLDSKISPKSETQFSDEEVNKATKVATSPRTSSKRPSEDLESPPASKRPALVSGVGSPKPSSPRKANTLSRDTTFKNLDKGKVKPVHAVPTFSGSSSHNTEWAPMTSLQNSSKSRPSPQSPRGTFLKSSSFSTSTSKSKVKLVQEEDHQKNKLSKHPSKKEGPVRTPKAKIVLKRKPKFTLLISLASRKAVQADVRSSMSPKPTNLCIRESDITDALSGRGDFKRQSSLISRGGGYPSVNGNSSERKPSKVEIADPVGHPEERSMVLKQ